MCMTKICVRKGAERMTMSAYIYGYVHTFRNLLHHKDKKQPLNSQVEKQPVVRAYSVMAWQSRTWVSQISSFFFYCEYCTRDGIAHILSQMYLVSSHSTPGRAPQQQDGSSIAAAQHHQILRKLASIMDVITAVMRYTYLLNICIFVI